MKKSEEAKTKDESFKALNVGCRGGGGGYRLSVVIYDPLNDWI